MARKAETRIEIEPEKGTTPEPQEKHHRGAAVAVTGAIAFLLLAAIIVVPTGLFTEAFGTLSFGKVFDQLASNVQDAAAVFVGSSAGGVYSSVVSRYIAAFVAGAALGACGAVYQGTFRNPLASPSTLGVINGCLFGTIVFYLFLAPELAVTSSGSVSAFAETLSQLSPLEYVWAVYGSYICAVIGGLVVAGVALAVSRALGRGALNNVVLVVIGQVFALVLGMLGDTIRYYFESTGEVVKANIVETAEGVPFSMFLSLADVAYFAVPVVAVLVLLVLFRSQLNILSFSDEEARAAGVNAGRLRTIIVIVCTVATGVVVAGCGPIAFVGFVCPHVARRIVGPNFRYLLPMSLFVGAIYLIFVLCLASQFNLSLQQGFNLISTMIGCVVFLIVSFRGRGGAHAWN